MSKCGDIAQRASIIEQDIGWDLSGNGTTERASVFIFLQQRMNVIITNNFLSALMEDWREVLLGLKYELYGLVVGIARLIFLLCGSVEIKASHFFET